jgi:hypothetical protein
MDPHSPYVTLWLHSALDPYPPALYYVTFFRNIIYSIFERMITQRAKYKRVFAQNKDLLLKNI